MSIRAYLGGSFDPIHKGHIQMAELVQQALSCAKQAGEIDEYHVSLLPTKGNPFKDKQTPITERLAMLTLALQDSDIGIDTTELSLPAPNYTIDTVHLLISTYPNECLILIMGLDSLVALPTWKSGLDILNFVHLWVFLRAGSGQIPDELLPYISHQAADLFTQKTGVIYMDNTPILDISSTTIRQKIAHGEANLPLAEAVADYIKAHQLYV